MGSVCCCFQGDNIENRPSMCSNCIPFNCCIPNFVNVYTLLFHREEDGQAAPTTIEAAAAAARTTTASATDDVAFSEIYRSPSRPLPYDVNPRNLDFLPGKLSKFTNDERLTEAITKASPLKLSLSESKAEFAYFYTQTEDEDVCPTCLEEYTPENPKIVTKCSHNFHLGCIYEWMERSDTCPVCGKITKKFNLL